MYTVAMIISLELVVADNTQRGCARALAWVVLVMVWGSMRCDDVQSALPHRTTLSNYGLRMVLGKSKTSGPDKNTERGFSPCLQNSVIDWRRLAWDWISHLGS